MRSDVEIFSLIANDVISKLDQSWEQVSISLWKMGQMTKYTLNFLYEGQKHFPIILIKDVAQLLIDVKEFTSEKSYVPWNQIQLTVQSDGKLNIKYLWDQEWEDDCIQAQAEADAEEAAEKEARLQSEKESD